MKTTFAFAVPLLALGAATAFGVSKFEHDSDHTMLVNILSVPAGAEVYAVPASTNAEPILLGRTPYTALVEFDWGKGWFTRKWNRLSVYAPGEICRAEYTSADKLYDIYMIFKVEAPGYEPAYYDELIASFRKPKDLDWEHMDFLPNRETIEVELVPVAGAATAPETPKAAAAPTTVMMASETDGAAALGTVHVVANVEDATVLVDGKPAGRVPVKLMLAAGGHSVEVHKPGFLSYSNNLTVKAHSQVALKVTLAKGASEPAAAPAP